MEKLPESKGRVVKYKAVRMDYWIVKNMIVRMERKWRYALSILQAGGFYLIILLRFQLLEAAARQIFSLHSVTVRLRLLFRIVRNARASRDA